jgi:hypothetical protein
MRFYILLISGLTLVAPECIAELGTNGNFIQEFTNDACFLDETNGNYTVKWCPTNQNYDKINGNPKGSLTVETLLAGEPGARIWYLFDGASPQPVSLHVEFDYSNLGADKHHTPTTGRAESQTSTDITLNCLTDGWKKQRELSTTWYLGGMPKYETESFDVEIDTATKSVYIQFTKPRPQRDRGVVMKIDNIKITPRY